MYRTIFCVLFICGLAFSANVEQVEVFDEFDNSIKVFGEDIASSEKLLDDSFALEGAFKGFVDGKVVFAGGRNTDGSLSSNIYWFDISSPQEVNEALLDEPIAFGGSFVNEDRLFCVGGMTIKQATDKVFSLSFKDGKLLQQTEIWRLPEPLSHHATAYLDGYIYVAGGSDRIYVINEDTSEVQRVQSNEFMFEYPALIAQNKAVFVFGGVAVSGEQSKAVYKVENERVDGVKIKRLLDCPAALGACSGAVISQSHVLINSTQYIESPLVYHTVTDTWVRFNGDMPQGVFTSTIDTGNEVVFAGADGIYKATLKEVKSLLRPLDYAIIVAYLAILVWIGFYFSKREKSTENFFVGGRTVPTWAVAFSLFATGTSGISFMAIPAKAYMTNLVFFGAVFIGIPFTVALAYIMPYFRRLQITSVYEYLEMRFDGPIRLAGASVCLVYQLGARMSVAMYIPAIALTAVTGVDITLSILVMGILATIYTVLGGIEAVIWSDVVQSIVMIGGAIIAVFILLAGTSGGVTGYVDLNVAYDKFKMFDMRWDYTLPVVWIMIANCFAIMIQALTDQSILQRVFCTKNAKEARNSQLMSVVIAVTMAIVFWGIGTMLFSYFKSNPKSLIPSLPDDSVFPLFIVKKIPVGLCGLVIAGLFSAAMSTLDSSMNTVSAVIVTDFYSKIKPNANEQAKMKLARYSTVVVGVLGTGFALFLAASGIKSIFDVWMTLAGLLLSALPAVMILGLFTKRTSRVGAYVSIAVSIVMAIYIKNTQLHFFMYGFVIMMTATVAGYITSFVFKEKRDMAGLTFWSSK